LPEKWSSFRVGHTPLLEATYKTERPLEGGGVALANDEYLPESILYPDAKVRAGYKPTMLSYKGQVGERELLELLAFIKGLGPAQTPPRAEETDPPAVFPPQPEPKGKKKP
jgi:hypothetical protein